MHYKLLIALLFISVALQAQHTYEQAAGFKYLEVVKNTGTPDANLPVIIAFHYSSSTPQKTISEYDQLKKPVRLILPRGNYHKRTGYTYFPPDFYSKDSLTQIEVSKHTLDSIAAFVRFIGNKYNRKPVVAGFSQGGDLSFLLAVYHPELITAAFPLAGFIHRQRLPDVKRHAQKTVPIMIYQGEADKIIAVSYTRKMVQELAACFSISVKTYPDLGHDFSDKMKEDYAAQMVQYFSR